MFEEFSAQYLTQFGSDPHLVESNARRAALCRELADLAANSRRARQGTWRRRLHPTWLSRLVTLAGGRAMAARL